MKKIILLMMSVFLVITVLVSCSDDSNIVNLYPEDADLTNAPNIMVEQTDKIDNLGGWQEGDMPFWNVTFEEDIQFELELEYSRYNAPAVWGDVLIEGTNGHSSVMGIRFTPTSTSDNDWSKYERIEDSLSSRLPAGDYKITLIPDYAKNEEVQPQHFINLRSMSFIITPKEYEDNGASLTGTTQAIDTNETLSNENDHQQDRKDWEELYGRAVSDITAENIENYTGTWYLNGDTTNKYYKFSDNDYEGFDLDGYPQIGIWGVEYVSTYWHDDPIPKDEVQVRLFPSDGIDARLSFLSIDDIVLYNRIFATYYVREEALGSPEADLLMERFAMICPDGDWSGDNLLLSFDYYNDSFTVFPQDDIDTGNLLLDGVWHIDGDTLTFEFIDGTVEVMQIIENEFTVDYYGGITFSIQ